MTQVSFQSTCNAPNYLAAHWCEKEHLHSVLEGKILAKGASHLHNQYAQDNAQ